MGPGTLRALHTALELAREWGLTTGEDEGYVGTVDINSCPDMLHILAHLDIVGVGEGWDTDPFTLTREGDLLYGRGVLDDKGPALAALFALRCVRELGLPLSYNARLILGTDEETGSRDIAHYYAAHPYAPCAITPDADFPVINVEKARYAPTFRAAWQPQPPAAGHVASIDGGIRVNVAPGNCTAHVLGLSPQDISAAMEAVEQRTGVAFAAQQTPEGVTIRATGVQAHAAHPQGGKNAITAMLELLAVLPLARDEASETVHTLHRFFPYGDNGGSALGIAMEDAVSGPTTLVLSMLNLDETGFTGCFDCRASLCANEDNTQAPVERLFAAQGWECAGEFEQGHAVDENSDFIRTLLESYQMYTGRPGRCLAIGGGTYVHDIPGGVAFGCAMPGVDNRMHEPDEFAILNDLVLSAKMFAQVILDVCR